MQYKFIVIEGNIGAGKTSLTQKIGSDCNAQIILEQFADNPFLPKFYENKERYSFPLELSFLAERYHQLSNELNNRNLFKTFTVSDYYFMKSLIFAANTLQTDEYKLYVKLFNIIYQSLPKPDLYVYLHLNTENLMRNIQKRGREYERHITEDYLRTIQNGYFNFFKQNTYLKFLIIDTNNVDFVNNYEDYQNIMNHIFEKQYNMGINRIIL